MACFWLGSVSVLWAAEPPRLSEVTFTPSMLTVGSGKQLITVSVVISDPDDNLDPERLKVKRIVPGKKNPIIAFLTDDGAHGDVMPNDGRFTAQFSIGTKQEKEREYRIQVKDLAGMKARSITGTVTVRSPLSVLPDFPPEKLELVLEPVFQGLTFSEPVDLIQAPGDNTRWFVVGRQGVIQSFENDVAADTLTTALDLSSDVQELSEFSLELGMLAMTFHPNFDTNRTVYIYYATGSPNAIETRLSSFLVGDDGVTFDPSSETVLLRLDQPTEFHNGGQLGFGPDGFLYLSLGDGGDRFRSLDLESLFGKMLRIDVDGGVPYAIPPDNPFVGREGRPEIYALGFRNPWRWSFDPVNGTLWLGDVGQKRWEEINVVVPGGNYGWPVREGFEAFQGFEDEGGAEFECTSALACDDSSLIDPVIAYDPNEGCAVIGGHVYRGSKLPAIEGAYIFSDFCSGAIMALSLDQDRGVTRTVLVEGGANILVRSLSVDQEGGIYIIDDSGRIFRLVATER